MAFKKKENKYKDTKIDLPAPELWVGATVEKTATFSVCTGLTFERNNNGEDVLLLVWETTLKETGQKKIYKTTAIPLRVGDIRATSKSFEQKS